MKGDGGKDDVKNDVSPW